MEEQKREYRVVNLNFEYPGYVGTYKWAVISKLSEEQLKQRYGYELQELMPYIYLTLQQGEAFSDFHRNEDKYEKRRKRREDSYGYDDGISEIYHIEIANDELFENLLNKELCQRVFQAVSNLTTVQKRRVYLYFYEDKSCMEIARMEGVNHSKVKKSIEQALKKLKKFLE